MGQKYESEHGGLIYSQRFINEKTGDAIVVYSYTNPLTDGDPSSIQPSTQATLYEAGGRGKRIEGIYHNHLDPEVLYKLNEKKFKDRGISRDDAKKQIERVTERYSYDKDENGKWVGDVPQLYELEHDVGGRELTSYLKTGKGEDRQLTTKDVKDYGPRDDIKGKKLKSEGGEWKKTNDWKRDLNYK